MKGVASKILIALGILLILAAILWWAIAVNSLVKLPSDIDSVTEYEGTMTYYVDPISNQPLPEGEELQLDMKVERNITSNADEFDSSRGVLDEEIVLDLGIQKQSMEFAYVLDRKSIENVKDDRAWAWDPANVVDREGTYYPLLGFDVSKDETYLIWKNEIDAGLEAEFIDEQDLEGVTVYNFSSEIMVTDKKEVAPVYIEALGLPAEMTFDDLKPSLQALGVDVDGLLVVAQQVLSAEDQQALGQVLQETVPANYYWAMDTKISVEPKTGLPVDVYKNVESLYMELDMTKLAGLFTILNKYKDDPNLGPALAQLEDLQVQLAQAEPNKIFEYSYEQTDETVKDAVDEAKDSASKVNLVKVYIPWALLIVGALILIIGLLIGGGRTQQPEA
ncbi:MAG: porin PorA family protein [Actinomycetota bacterium]|nr:porin PorA family protein [Actinomycetota bacterium]